MPSIMMNTRILFLSKLLVLFTRRIYKITSRPSLNLRHISKRISHITTKKNISRQVPDAMSSYTVNFVPDINRSMIASLPPYSSSPPNSWPPSSTSPPPYSSPPAYSSLPISRPLSVSSPGSIYSLPPASRAPVITQPTINPAMSAIAQIKHFISGLRVEPRGHREYCVDDCDCCGTEWRCSLCEINWDIRC